MTILYTSSYRLCYCVVHVHETTLYAGCNNCTHDSIPIHETQYKLVPRQMGTSGLGMKFIAAASWQCMLHGESDQ